MTFGCCRPSAKLVKLNFHERLRDRKEKPVRMKGRRLDAESHDLLSFW